MNTSNPNKNMQNPNSFPMNQSNTNTNFPQQNIPNQFQVNYSGNQMMQGPQGYNQPNQYSNQHGSINN